MNVRRVAASSAFLVVAAAVAAQGPINPYLMPRFTVGLGAPGLRYAMDTIADMDGDAVEDLIVGVSSGPGGTVPGVVHIVSGASTPPGPRIIASLSGSVSSPGFGASVSSFAVNPFTLREDVIVGDDERGRVQILVVVGTSGFTSHETPALSAGIALRYGRAVRRSGPNPGAGEVVLVGDPEFRASLSTIWDGLFEVIQPTSFGGFNLIASHVGGTSRELGASITTIADLDGDGIREAVVGGTRIHSPSGTPCGGAYVYRSAGAYSGGPQGTMFARINGQKLGFSATTIGDTNGDGFDEVALGAPFPTNSSRSGVYLYDGAAIAGATPGSFLPASLLLGNVDLGTPGGRLGGSIGGGVDINSDGRPDLLIAAPAAAPTDGQFLGFDVFGGAPATAIVQPSPTFASYVHRLAGGVAAVDPATGTLYAF